MARLKKKRKRKRVLRNLVHLCAILAVLFVLAKGVAFIGKETIEPIGKAAVLNVLGQDGGGEPAALDTKEVSAVLTDTNRYPQDYLDALENNPELLEFVKGYPDAEKTASGGLKQAELDEPWPLLLQWDRRWGYVPYGDHDIGLSGCAPTCLSMVIVGLTKNKAASPDAVAEYAEENGYYLYGTGTKWSLMTEGAAFFGVQGRELALDENRIFEALYYEKAKIQQDYKEMANYILENLHGMTFPGWEPERMAKLDELFEMYRPVTKERLWDNLKYFLEALMPVCHETGIKMAIHPDDPPWDIFGLPRLLVDKESIERFLKMVDDPYNCLCLCSGSLGANKDNDIPAIIRSCCDRIAFAHIRNVKHFDNGDFSEASHRDCDGDTQILEIMRAYHECGFDGYIRPDHGRHIWGEQCRPGYGLYDRALGIMYMWGCWDMLEREAGNI